ncbi:MAG TPA: ribosome small subunit-dependent GTPase A [bacterium]|nr:ribosome small subunit-dependent GTPase A [bacterium]HPN30622.1 ribosome small subunit-dependent GTPase A [bacterium]
MEFKNLENLGFCGEIRNSAEGRIKEGFSPARVIEVNKNSYTVSDGSYEMIAELTGKLLYDAETPEVLPTVGDWVKIQSLNDNSLAIVHSVLPRKTLLKRKEPGKKIEFQLIAANIDCGLVVQSAERVNFNLLERYFVMLNESKIQPVVVITKIDLLSGADLDNLKQSFSNLKNKYIFISNVLENGLNELSKILEAGKTYCLLGQSGTGKTSLLNGLIGEPIFKVGEIRKKDGKGRHTTVRRQLIVLENKSIFVDTPGIKQLGNFEIENGMEQTFDEFSLYSKRCRFKDCSHIHENGCAIIEAVENGEIPESRYNNFLRLKKESEFYDMSYQEKRKRDKSFGKMVKNYKKYMRNNIEFL